MLDVSIYWRGVAGGCGVLLSCRDLSFADVSFAVARLIFGVVLVVFGGLILEVIRG